MVQKTSKTSPKAHKPRVKKTEAQISTEEIKKPAAKTPYLYAIGRRKTAAAKVRLYPDGQGVTVNGKPVTQYFITDDLQKTILSPLAALGQEKQVRIESFVSGGGITAQAGALRHGISRALVLKNQEDKVTLKKLGFLTRDSRRKERKKPGLRKARRRPQWSKR